MEFIKYFCLSFFLIIFSHSDAQEEEKIQSDVFQNMYRVSIDLYRSEQPSKEGFEVIDSIGIRTVLNLRNRVSDKYRARKSNVVLKRVKINSWQMSYEDILGALEIIRNSEKPVLVHCLHGSDRTGAVVAAYRMVYQDWTKEDAINEFLKEEYGYHENWFPDILNLLKELNLEKLRSDLKK